MRYVMKISIPVEAGNQVASQNKIGMLIKSILDDLQPEAAYFLAENGCRTAHVYFHMEEASQIPSIVEPWFLAFNAAIEIQPVMVLEDLAQASDDIASAVQKYTK